MTDAVAPASPTATAPPTEPPISPVQAVIGTFAKPSETFRRLVARPTWWLPFVLWFVIATIGGAIFTSKTDWEQAAQATIQKSADSGRAIPDSAAPRIASFMRITGMVIAPVFTVLGAFLGALVLWGLARMFGGEVRYVQTLALLVHAYLPKVLGGIVGIVILSSMAPGSIELQNATRIIKSSLAAFLPEGSAQWALALASSVEVFWIWTIALVAIAFGRIPSLSKGAAVTISVILWILVALIQTLPALRS